MKKILLTMSVLVGVSLSSVAQAYIGLANYIGTGKGTTEDPYFIMKLVKSEEGNKIGTKVGYGYNFVFENPSWSVWNIYDGNDNYYGTLSVNGGGEKDKAWLGFKSYEGGDGYYLQGLQVQYGWTDASDKIKYFKVTASGVCNPDLECGTK
ncbi:MAG: hypothetical protein CMF50_02405 [Legionellales bacterium]|nr:hypothetical protein [Legionellales bacterium]|tara:strand:- start:51655 stop:52107 length:453 start_codon:yes stop_codon:yes gene_type:complete